MELFEWEARWLKTNERFKCQNVARVGMGSFCILVYEWRQSPQERKEALLDLVDTLKEGGLIVI